MASDKPEIIVRVVNEIVDNTGQLPTSPQSTSLPTSGGLSGNARFGGSGIIGGFSAQFMAKGATRLMGAFGNNELTNAMQDTTKYTFLGIRALGGDPTAIASLALDLASQAIKGVMDVARKNAQTLNDVDLARQSQGLMNMDGVKVTKNFWTGRYEYSRE